MNLQLDFSTNKQDRQQLSKQWMEETEHLLPKFRRISGIHSCFSKEAGTEKSL